VDQEVEEMLEQQTLEVRRKDVLNLAQMRGKVIRRLSIKMGTPCFDNWRKD